jgi:hypothetical protein
MMPLLSPIIGNCQTSCVLFPSLRGTGRLSQDLDVKPSHVVGEAGAERFGYRFLGGVPASVKADVVWRGIGLGPLVRREYCVSPIVVWGVKVNLNSGQLHQVNAVSADH